MSPQEPLSQERSPSSWSALVQQARLGWRLLRDPLVPGWTKLVPLGAVLYVLLPADLIPDIFLGFGQLDDLGVLLLGLRAFIFLCPRTAVQRQQTATSVVDGVAREVKDQPAPGSEVAGYLVTGQSRVADDPRSGQSRTPEG